MFAKRAGFDRPILHGLCTYGFTGRALLHAVCGSDPARFRSMAGRFSRPTYPGDTLTISMWADGDGVRFRTDNQRGETVIDAGRFTHGHGERGAPGSPSDQRVDAAGVRGPARPTRRPRRAAIERCRAGRRREGLGQVDPHQRAGGLGPGTGQDRGHHGVAAHGWGCPSSATDGGQQGDHGRPRATVARGTSLAARQRRRATSAPALARDRVRPLRRRARR